jgi:hypothetical protein
MASFKSHPFFYTSLLLIGAVTAGEAWLVFSQRAQAAKLTEEIVQKREALDSFGRQQPFPSKDNVGLVDADRREIEKTRDEIRNLLRATGPTAEKLAAARVPTTSTETWYEINNYVEGVRGKSQEANITLPVENRLGFSLYAREGPERDLISAVFRQRQFADYLMGVLIAARPREILSLHRERPLTPAEKQAETDAIAAGQPSPFASSGMSEGSDYFAIDPRTSARVPGFIETTPFRLNFVGTTGSLRSVLNQLAKFELPVVVRSVEVESLSKSDSGAGAAAGYTPPANPFGNFGGDAAGTQAVEPVKPLVEQTDSRFVVTVEFISLVEKTLSNAETPAASNP